MRGSVTGVLFVLLAAFLVTMASPVAALPVEEPTLPPTTNASAPHPSATTTYTLTALGTLGGICSQPFAINAWGQIVGRSSTAGCGSDHAFIWDNGALHDMHVPGGQVEDINDVETAVGSSGTIDPPTRYAWTWTEEEGVQPLDCSGLDNCQALAINNLGQVVGGGTVDYSGGDHYSLLWDEGGVTRIAPPAGCDVGSLSAINDEGLASGATLCGTVREAALYDGNWTSLGTLIHPYCVSRAINASDHVVGTCHRWDSLATVAFLWTEEDGMVQLEGLGGAHTIVLDINDGGQAVGVAYASDGSRHAALWQDGGMTELNDLVPEDSGWVLQEAAAINNAGQIVGTGVRDDISANHYQAFLLTPSAPSDDVTPPAEVDDLQATVYASQKTTKPDEIHLIWTAPGDDGNEGTATQYDIRYATSPITEASWGSALQVSNEPTPATAGTGQMMTVKGLSGGVRWHFALKTLDEPEAGNSSRLSNIPSILTMEFRPNPNGYSFPNYNASGPGDPDFSIEDMDRIWQDYFGESICKARTPDCIPYLRKARQREVWNEIRMKGNCLGFALTSTRFHLGMDSQSGFQAGATTTYSLQKDNVRRHIAYYQTTQHLGPAWVNRTIPYPDTASEVLDQIVQGLQGSAPDPPILSMCEDATYMRCHVVNPIAVEWSDPDDTSLYVWVYDSIYPGQLDLLTQMDLHTETDSWVYYGLLKDREKDYAFDNLWQGQAGANTLKADSLSEYLSAQAASASELEAVDPDALVQVQSLGGGHLLITDGNGQRLGFDGDTPINEIAGAGAVPLPGGAYAPFEPRYFLPAGADYAVVIDGQTLSTTVGAEVAQSGPTYAAWVDDVSLAPGTQERFQVAQDGTTLTYTAASAQQLALGLALDGATSQQVEVRGLGVTADQAAELAFDVAAGRARVQGSSGVADAYDLKVVVLDADGNHHTFAHYGVPLAPGEAHYVEYGAWDGSGDLTVGIDRDGDGVAEEILVLANTPGRLFLPMTVR